MINIYTAGIAIHIVIAANVPISIGTDISTEIGNVTATKLQ